MTRIAAGRDGDEIEVSVVGSGPPLYFIAGLGDGLDSWAAVIAELVDSYSCVSFDNRGCGASDTPPGPYAIEDFVADAYQVISKIGLGAGPVVGSSMGGAIAQLLTVGHPEIVTALVLSNSLARSNRMTWTILGHWIALARTGQTERLAESTSIFSFSGNYLAANFPAEGAEYPLIENVEGFVAAATGCRRFDASADLGSIAVPTLVIAGTHDILTTVGNAEELAGFIPGATMTTLASGHMICLEMPIELAACVRRFLHE